MNLFLLFKLNDGCTMCLKNFLFCLIIFTFLGEIAIFFFIIFRVKSTRVFIWSLFAHFNFFFNSSGEHLHKEFTNFLFAANLSLIIIASKVYSKEFHYTAVYLQMQPLGVH